MNTIGTSPELKPQKDYYYRLMKLEDLPSASLVLQEVTKMVEDTSTNVVKLSEVISRDQGLTTKMLAVANSPIYELSRRVSTIEYAIMVLGFEQIKQLTLSLSMIDNLDTRDNANWKKKEYWYHSLLTGSIAKTIAGQIGYANPGEAFTAGVMHDLGIIIRQRFFNDDYNKVYEAIKNTDKKVIEAEEDITGLNHSDIGLFMLNKWDIPYEICEAVMNHHYPEASKKFPLPAYIIRLADILANQISPFQFIWDRDVDMDPMVLDKLKVDEKFCDDIINYFKDFKLLQIF